MRSKEVERCRKRRDLEVERFESKHKSLSKHVLEKLPQKILKCLTKSMCIHVVDNSFQHTPIICLSLKGLSSKMMMDWDRI